MGVFHVKVAVASILDPAMGQAEDEELLVDTGSTYTSLPQRVLSGLGVPRLGRIPVRLANGQIIEKDYGAAMLCIEGRVIATIVLFGGPEDISVLGATSLELAAFAVDPVAKKLVPVQAIQAYFQS